MMKCEISCRIMNWKLKFQIPSLTSLIECQISFLLICIWCTQLFSDAKLIFSSWIPPTSPQKTWILRYVTAISCNCFTNSVWVYSVLLYNSNIISVSKFWSVHISERVNQNISISMIFKKVVFFYIQRWMFFFGWKNRFFVHYEKNAVMKNNIGQMTTTIISFSWNFPRRNCTISLCKKR